MKFSIPVENMVNLTKKMTRIQNKCRKYGCDFRFEIVGEEMREIDKDTKIKCCLVEAEGIAIINNWQFVASLEHTDKGNIIDKAVEIEVPERYYTTAPICEHGKTNHARKNTYIIRNIKTNEFKQVGTACLKDFTFGMSAEAVAKYASALHEIEEEQEHFGSGYNGYYYDKEKFLMYVVETVNKFGYVKSGEDDSTVQRVRNFIWAKRGIFRGRYEAEWGREILADLEKVNFRPDTEENKEIVRKALAWVVGQEVSNNYMHNLITVCKLGDVEYKNTGILTSLIPVYYKAVERELKMAEKKAEQKELDAKSEWQGKIGDKLNVQVEEWRVVTSWRTDWGYTYVYKMVDKDGNIFTWKTSKYIPENMAKFVIKGTIKNHNEFREAKQTELTRCKIIKAITKEEVEETHEAYNPEVENAINDFLDYCNGAA